MKDFGYPPAFPEGVPITMEEETKEGPVDPSKKVRKGKSKVLAKGSTLKYQWQIMRSLGMDDEEIKRCVCLITSEPCSAPPVARFSDPSHWLDYFPPCTARDLKAFGASVSSWLYQGW